MVMMTMTVCLCVCVRYKKRFHKFDKERKGFITTVDVQQVLEVSYHLDVYVWTHSLLIDCCCLVSFQNINVHIDENSLHEILNEVDLNKNGQVEIDEFLQVRSSLMRTDGFRFRLVCVCLFLLFYMLHCN